MVYNWDGKEAECHRLYVQERRSLDEVKEYWEQRGFTPRWVTCAAGDMARRMNLRTASDSSACYALADSNKYEEKANDASAASEPSRHSSRYGHAPSSHLELQPPPLLPWPRS